MTPEGKRNLQSGTTVERLLENNGTLYGERPSIISTLIRNKLNQISKAGKDITAVVAIPDYHNIQRDAGTKDILFTTQPSLSPSIINWEITSMLPKDSDTMYGTITADIQVMLTRRIKELEEQGNVVRHIIPIADNHSRPMIMLRRNGFNGLKNFIICYHKK